MPCHQPAISMQTSRGFKRRQPQEGRPTNCFQDKGSSSSSSLCYVDILSWTWCLSLFEWMSSWIQVRVHMSLIKQNQFNLNLNSKALSTPCTFCPPMHHLHVPFDFFWPKMCWPKLCSRFWIMRDNGESCPGQAGSDERTFSAWLNMLSRIWHARWGMAIDS